MRMPGFTADLSLVPAVGRYHTLPAASASSGAVVPQLDAVGVLSQLIDWILSTGSAGGGGGPARGGSVWSSAPGPTNAHLIRQCRRECFEEYLAAKRECDNEETVSERRTCRGKALARYDDCLVICN